MLTILICLAHNFLPKVVLLALEIETQAAALALVVFGVLLYRVWYNHRRVHSSGTDSSRLRRQ
jgi:hypothetical protein